jgi:hypothetical protein
MVSLVNAGGGGSTKERIGANNIQEVVPEFDSLCRSGIRHARPRERYSCRRLGCASRIAQRLRFGEGWKSREYQQQKRRWGQIDPQGSVSRVLAWQNWSELTVV